MLTLPSKFGDLPENSGQGLVFAGGGDFGIKPLTFTGISEKQRFLSEAEAMAVYSFALNGVR